MQKRRIQDPRPDPQIAIAEIERGEVALIRVADCDMRIESTIVYSRRKPLSPAAEAIFENPARTASYTKGDSAR